MAASRGTYSDFRQILTGLNQGELRPMYFAMGADYYLYQGFIQSLRSAFTQKYGTNASFVQRWGADLKVASDVSSLLGGGGLFSSASLVMLHEIQDAGNPVKTKLAEMMGHIPADTVVLAHYSIDDYRKAKWLHAMQQLGSQVPLKRPEVTELPAIVKSMAESRALVLDQAAAFRLIELSSGELAIIDNELEKITLFLDEQEHNVTAGIVDQVAGSIENAHVFQFIEAVSQRDRRLAMQTLTEIHHQGKQGLPYLVALLYNRLIQLMALRETPEARKSINREGTSGYFLRQLGPVAKNYTLPELQVATRQLADIDLRFRLGSIDLLTSFSSWISKVL